MLLKPSGGQALGVPEAVLGKARALGPPGQRWLESLPELIRDLEREWDLVVGPALGGGSEAYVAAATMADGTPAVLKLQMPGYGKVADQIRVLRLAKGRGYVLLLQADEARGALLLERLGQPMSEMMLSTGHKIALFCAVLKQAWIRTPGVSRFPTGAWKARWLRAFIAEAWRALNEPCSERVIDQALLFTETREAAFDPKRSVLVHGDVHGANVLAPYQGTDSARRGLYLVDPEGLFAERAYDLALVMRDWSEELLAGDALRLGRAHCAHLGYLAGEDVEAIWQWGFVERVSTGLLLLQTGGEREGRDYLRVAEAWLQP